MTYRDYSDQFTETIDVPPIHGQNGSHPSSSPNGEGWWVEPASIPPRSFLYGRHYIRGAVGATIAAGGRAKTTLSYYEAISMTAGRNLATGDALPAGPLRVWCVNGEEDQDEINRRLAAVCRRYNVTKADLGGRLIAQSVRDSGMSFASMKGSMAVLSNDTIAEAVEFISRRNIDVVMVDPLVSFHSIPENDNVAMDLLIKRGLGALARSRCAVELFHHPGKPKPGQTDASVEDGRGASATERVFRQQHLPPPPRNWPWHAISSFWRTATRRILGPSVRVLWAVHVTDGLGGQPPPIPSRAGSRTTAPAAAQRRSGQPFEQRKMMPGTCKGLFKIGDKAAGVVTHVQVQDDFYLSAWPMDLPSYVQLELLPRHDDLPWREDWAAVSGPRAAIG